MRSVCYGNMEFVSSKYAIKVAKIQWKFNPDCRYLSNSVRYLENVRGFTVALCQTNFPPGIWLGAFSSGENVQSQTPLKEGECTHDLTGSPEIIFQPLPGGAKVKLWREGRD